MIVLQRGWLCKEERVYEGHGGPVTQAEADAEAEAEAEADVGPESEADDVGGNADAEPEADADDPVWDSPQAWRQVSTPAAKLAGM